MSASSMYLVYAGGLCACPEHACQLGGYECEIITPGLVAVMLLLGFGLVRIPRSMLQEADPAARLAYAHHK